MHCCRDLGELPNQQLIMRYTLSSTGVFVPQPTVSRSSTTSRACSLTSFFFFALKPILNCFYRVVGFSIVASYILACFHSTKGVMWVTERERHQQWLSSVNLLNYIIPIYWAQCILNTIVPSSCTDFG